MPVQTTITHWILRCATALIAFAPLSAYAQADLFPRGLQEDISWMVTIVISMMNILTWVAFVILQYLLDPAFIFDLGGQNSFLSQLNEVWTLARDLVNILFAVLLIGAAVYVVIRANKDIISEYAPKFILSVILVNFSWFGPLLIIDIANVAAAAAFGVPSLLMEPGDCKVRSHKEIPGAMCEAGTEPDSFTCGCQAVVDAVFLLDEGELKTYETDDAKSKGWTCHGGLICLQYQNLDVDTVSGHSAILNGLIVNHARLQFLATVSPDGEGDGPGKLFKFLIRQILILVIHVALFFPLAALVLAFAIRIPVLWITLAFMPFVFLQFVVKDTFTMGWPQKIWDYFLKAAFLPAAVAIPFSIGFIMINAGASISIPTVENALNVGIRINEAIGDLHELLWLAMALGVMWVGIFTILESMSPDFSKGAIGGIKGMGETLGKIAIKAPLSAPVIPGVGNVLSLPGRMQNFENALSGPGGLGAATENWRNAGIPGSSGSLANDGRKMQSDPALQRTMKDEIEKLIATIKQKPGDAAHAQTAINTFRSSVQGKFNFSANLDKDSVLAELKQLQARAGEAAMPKGLVDSLETELKKIASTPPPTTPPPTTPPPADKPPKT